MKCPWPDCNNGTFDYGPNRKPEPCPCCARAEALAREAMAVYSTLSVREPWQDVGTLWEKSLAEARARLAKEGA